MQNQQQFEYEVMRELWEEQNANYLFTEAWDVKHEADPHTGTCKVCGDSFSAERKALGYDICLWCGEEQAMQDRQYWTVVPLNKSNYQLITNREELKGLNPKSNNADLKRYMDSLNENGEAPL